jgi:hypothetical protein
VTNINRVVVFRAGRVGKDDKAGARGARVTEGRAVCVDREVLGWDGV